MGKWIHRLSHINLTERTAICSECGEVKIKIKQGRPKCAIVDLERDRVSRKKWWTLFGKTDKGREINAVAGRKYKHRIYRIHAKPLCERCAFIPKDMCQIEVHHKDRNRENNHPSNLESLCANCHNLEHKKVSKYQKIRDLDLYETYNGIKLGATPPLPKLASLEMQLFNDIGRLEWENENLQSRIDELQAGLTDPYIRGLRALVSKQQLEIARLS